MQRDDHTWSPLIHIHIVERHVHGNSVHIEVHGQIRIAAKERVYARELKLNTLQGLQLTAEGPFLGRGYVPLVYYHNKGEYDNYASVDIFNVTGGEWEELTAGHRNASQDGSVWFTFIAEGE